MSLPFQFLLLHYEGGQRQAGSRRHEQQPRGCKAGDEGKDTGRDPPCLKHAQSIRSSTEEHSKNQNTAKRKGEGLQQTGPESPSQSTPQRGKHKPSNLLDKENTDHRICLAGTQQTPWPPQRALQGRQTKSQGRSRELPQTLPQIPGLPSSPPWWRLQIFHQMLALFT